MSPTVPQPTIVFDPFELLTINHVPVDGRNTATSALPSPSKSIPCMLRWPSADVVVMVGAPTPNSGGNVELHVKLVIWPAVPTTLNLRLINVCVPLNTNGFKKSTSKTSWPGVVVLSVTFPDELIVPAVLKDGLDGTIRVGSKLITSL